MFLYQLEQEERENIQKVKNFEREKTTAELEAWQQKHNAKEQLQSHSLNKMTLKTNNEKSTQGGVSEEKARPGKCIFTIFSWFSLAILLCQ